MKKTLIMVSSNEVGHGDSILGKKLMTNFINTLEEICDLWKIIFINGGVKLVTVNSDVLDKLVLLEKKGINISVCKTCLNHFELLNKHGVGKITNMVDIVTSMQLADKIITL